MVTLQPPKMWAPTQRLQRWEEALKRYSRHVGSYVKEIKMILIYLTE
jgi:hypothetical protein